MVYKTRSFLSAEELLLHYIQKAIRNLVIVLLLDSIFYIPDSVITQNKNLALKFKPEDWNVTLKIQTYSVFLSDWIVLERFKVSRKLGLVPAERKQYRISQMHPLVKARR